MSAAVGVLRSLSLQFECSDVRNPELQTHFAALEHAALELQVSFCPTGELGYSGIRGAEG